MRSRAPSDPRDLNPLLALSPIASTVASTFNTLGESSQYPRQRSRYSRRSFGDFRYHWKISILSEILSELSPIALRYMKAILARDLGECGQSSAHSIGEHSESSGRNMGRALSTLPKTFDKSNDNS